MKRSKPLAPGRAGPLVVAMAFAAGLCMAFPAGAQLGLPPTVLPQQTSALQLPPVQPAPATLPLLPVLPPLPSVQLPALQQAPALPGLPPVLQKISPTVQTKQPLVVPGAVATPSGADALLRSPGSPVSESLRSLVPLQQLRATMVRELLHRHADVLEVDPMGEPARRQELLWVSPTTPALKSALALGFVVLREHDLPELGLRDVVLRPPTGMATAQALAQLRALAPDVEADFNHVYTRSGDAVAGGASPRAASPTPRRIGLIDGGVDRQHAALRGATVHVLGCGAVPHPSTHGTAVASLLVGRETAFAGSADGTTLFAADIYCGQPADGAAEAIALALAWMVRQNVAVVNISLVGPANRLVERAVQAMVHKGFLLVAAVGNDGPAAPPLYPAAYTGVVGVTAVSQQRKSLPEAAQGPHVMFAALGAGVAVAEPGGGYVLARGTSFAAPRVAALLALSLVAPDPHAASLALARLITSAVDLGVVGRDPVFGYGLVGAQR
ncbi:MAG: S8 family serine peptidase [Pseudomonadota bacterium]